MWEAATPAFFKEFVLSKSPGNESWTEKTWTPPHLEPAKQLNGPMRSGLARNLSADKRG
jgi:hypothetical protein